MKFQIKPNPKDDEVDMAPMIDMVFLLLIFFMVSAKMNQDQNIKLEIPVATHARVAKEAPDRITISVTDEGKIFLGATEVSIEELPEFVERAQREIGKDNLKCFLRGDNKVHFKEVRAVMKICADKGINEIIFAAYTD